jgi:uridine nucleosidase
LFLSRAAGDLQEIRDSKGRNGAYLYDCCQFYKAWHIKLDNLDGEPKH